MTVYLKETQEFLIEGGTYFGTTGLKDCLKAFLLLYGDIFASAGFLPQSPTLLSALLFFLMYHFSGDKATSHLMFLRLKVMKYAF